GAKCSVGRSTLAGASVLQAQGAPLIGGRLRHGPVGWVERHKRVFDVFIAKPIIPSGGSPHDGFRRKRACAFTGSTHPTKLLQSHSDLVLRRYPSRFYRLGSVSKDGEALPAGMVREEPQNAP